MGSHRAWHNWRGVTRSVVPKLEVRTNMREAAGYSSSPGRSGLTAFKLLLGVVSCHSRRQAGLAQGWLRAGWLPGLPVGHTELVSWAGPQQVVAAGRWAVFMFGLALVHLCSQSLSILQDPPPSGRLLWTPPRSPSSMRRLGSEFRQLRVWIPFSPLGTCVCPKQGGLLSRLPHLWDGG